MTRAKKTVKKAGKALFYQKRKETLILFWARAIQKEVLLTMTQTNKYAFDKTATAHLCILHQNQHCFLHLYLQDNVTYHIAKGV